MNYQGNNVNIGLSITCRLASSNAIHHHLIQCYANYNIISRTTCIYKLHTVTVNKGAIDSSMYCVIEYCVNQRS